MLFRSTAELAGFGTVTRTLEVAVGQQAIVNLQLAPSALQESVTVTGEAPLVDVSQSKLGGNIDTRQMQELPINGRNWMTLTLMAPGSRANAAQDSPVEREQSSGGLQFQMNIDGQSVTARKVLPEASWCAVTVTPGSTPPVVSVTAPMTLASCAYPTMGSARIVTTNPTTIHLIDPIFPSL